MDVREALKATKALLTPEVWVNRQPEQGEECLATAIFAVTKEYATRIGTIERILPLIPPNYWSITYWNDQPERTLAEVHELLDAAIASCALAH